MPASITGVGLDGIKSVVSKNLEQAALEAEQKRVAEAAAAKIAEEEETAKQKLADETAERIQNQVTQSMLAATKQELAKQQKAQEFIAFQESTKKMAGVALAAGIEECKVRYGYKGVETDGQRCDYFDQGFATITNALSKWVPGPIDLQPPPAILLLSLLSMTLDTSKPFEFKAEEWLWLSEALDRVDAVIAVRIRADHLGAMMTVLNALKYFVDSVPYVIGQEQSFLVYHARHMSANRTGLVSGFILTAAKAKKKLDDVMVNVAWTNDQKNDAGLCIRRKKIFDAFEWSAKKNLPSGTFDAYTYRPDLSTGEFGSQFPEFLMQAHFLAHRYTQTHSRPQGVMLSG